MGHSRPTVTLDLTRLQGPAPVYVLAISLEHGSSVVVDAACGDLATALETFARDAPRYLRHAAAQVRAGMSEAEIFSRGEL
jgi:hypothetical protein